MNAAQVDLDRKVIVASAKRIIALAQDVSSNDLRRSFVAEAAAIIALIGGGGATDRGRPVRLSIGDRDRLLAAVNVDMPLP